MQEMKNERENESTGVDEMMKSSSKAIETKTNQRRRGGASEK